MRNKNLCARKFKKIQGFTLIEIMIAVAIVGILSAIAYPNYASYVQRGKLMEASTALLSLRTSMEQYYQDNRTYATVGAPIISPCDPTKMPVMKGFDMTCQFGTPPEGFTAKATGKSSSANTKDFEYRITNTGAQSSTVGPAWGGGNLPCWIMKKEDTCT